MYVYIYIYNIILYTVVRVNFFSFLLPKQRTRIYYIIDEYEINKNRMWKKYCRTKTFENVLSDTGVEIYFEKNQIVIVFHGSEKSLNTHAI